MSSADRPFRPETLSEKVTRSARQGTAEAIESGQFVAPQSVGPAVAAAASATAAGIVAAGETMGLDKGWAKTVANLTAVATVFLLFSMQQRDQMSSLRELQRAQLDQARDDRKMFHDELAIIHTDSERKWDAISGIQQAMARMVVAVERQGVALERLVKP